MKKYKLKHKSSTFMMPFLETDMIWDKNFFPKTRVLRPDFRKHLSEKILRPLFLVEKVFEPLFFWKKIFAPFFSSKKIFAPLVYSEKNSFSHPFYFLPKLALNTGIYTTCYRMYHTPMNHLTLKGTIFARYTYFLTPVLIFVNGFFEKLNFQFSIFLERKVYFKEFCAVTQQF